MNDVVLIVLLALIVAAALAAAVGSWLVLRRVARASETPRDLLDKLLLIEAGVQSQPSHLREELKAVRETADGRDALLRKELTDGQVAAANAVERSTKAFSDFQRERLDAVAAQLKELKDATTAEQLQARTLLTEQLEKVRADGEIRQKEVRDTLTSEIAKLRQENAAELDKMRATVDEKLQSTLEKRFTDSFQLVTERLDQVHKGLGEMQTLATGVGDLKRVLTDVRQRGAWGEVQLGGLLEDMLTPEQFERQAKVRKGSDERVDFAIKLPHDEGVLLPIDCKFPQEDYDRLLHAHASGEPVAVEQAAKALEAAIRRQAKTIEDKYVHPPATTNFAIMYLPTEGLFAEVVRRPGLAAELQLRHRVTVTGPTTLAAVLNSLRMGFTSLTIQKRSGEVWSVLGTVKAEFEKYDGIWEKLAAQLTTASKTVDDARKKTGTITSKLKSVQSLQPPTAEPPLLELAGLPELAEDAPASRP